mgnify:CR=1 FL=1
MNYIDIIVGVILLFLGVRGFAKGLIVELASIAALFLGVWMAVKFSFTVEGYLASQTEIDPDYLPAAAFALVFIGVVIGVHFLARIVQRILKLAALGFVNRVAGAVFGVLKGAVILSFIFVFINSFGGGKFHLISPELRNNSLTYPYLSKLGPSVMPFITNSEWYQELDLMKDEIDLPTKHEEEIKPA